MTLTTLINRQIDLQTLKQVKFKSLAAAAVAKLVKYLTLYQHIECLNQASQST
jgi:hypothetical protein